jgi:hypothetical protein
MSAEDVHALLDRLIGPMPKPKPKVVTVRPEGASEAVVVRDADVVVSPKDPNAKRGRPSVVQVRAPDPGWVRPKPTAEEEAIIAQNRSRMVDRSRLAEVDPFNIGHWGQHD